MARSICLFLNMLAACLWSAVACAAAVDDQAFDVIAAKVFTVLWFARLAFDDMKAIEEQDG